MFEDLAALFHAEASKDQALLHAHEINRLEWRYSYANYGKSARYCAAALRKAGMSQVEIIPHPADGVTEHMDCIMPMAWDVKGARLEILSPADADPRVLADWEENPFCIAQWSVGTRPGGDEAEIVAEEEMLAGADVRGRIVLNSPLHHPRTIKRLAAERGALGVVSDWTEHRSETPDGVYWNNEWSQAVGGWYGGLKEDEQSPIWCISITPRKGTCLRRLMASGKERPVRLRAVIKARLYKGAINTVTGLLPARRGGGREVLLLAHLYEPMADDNAVGVGAVVEIVRAIRSLTEAGEIPPLRRSIRVLFSMEHHGLAAYLATHPAVRARAVAALNMDAVSFDQGISGRPAKVMLNPDYQASFADSLFSGIARLCVERYAPTLKWQIERAAGNDNFISDPTIGIPCNQFYPQEGHCHHNSLNDFSCVNPEILHASMTMGATFAFAVASATTGEALRLGAEIAGEARSRLAQETESLLSGIPPATSTDARSLLEKVRRHLDHLREAEVRRVRSLRAISGGGAPRLSNTLDAFSRQIARASRDGIRTAEERIKALHLAPVPAAHPHGNELAPIERVAQNMTPVRKVIGEPLNYARIPRELREKVAAIACPLALMWADGKCNLLEILRKVQDDQPSEPVDARKLLRYFRSLERYGYIGIRYAVTLRKADIKRALRRIGVRKNDILFLHSSLSSAGPVRGGADTVIEALMEVLSPGGTLVMPTNCDEGVIGVTECGFKGRYPPAPPHVPIPWDPKTSRAYTGAIPNAFWPRKDVLRSAHPTHSVAAWGKHAAEFVRGHGPGTACCGRESVYGKMVDCGGKFLYFACSLRSSTFLHAVEDWADLGYMPTADVLMQTGGRVVTVKALNYPEGCRSFYQGPPNKVTRKMEELGITVRKVPIGLSNLQMVEARDFYKLFGALQKEPDLFLCEGEAHPFCAWARARIAERAGMRSASGLGC